MEQPTTLVGAIEEIQELRIEAAAMRVLIDLLKNAIVKHSPEAAADFEGVKQRFTQTAENSTDESKQIRQRLVLLTQHW